MAWHDACVDTSRAVELCLSAHQRVLKTLADLDDDTVRQPSLLPDWTVGHVVTHLARNADGHARRLEAALRGEDVKRYPGGEAQREREIEEGHARPAQVMVEDLRTSQERLEDVWRRCAERGWTFDVPDRDDDWPLPDSPKRRLRETELHHSDMGLGYTPQDWPAEYVAWELATQLRALPGRLQPGDDLRLLTGLTGRAPWPSTLELGPW